MRGRWRRSARTDHFSPRRMHMFALSALLIMHQATTPIDRRSSMESTRKVDQQSVEGPAEYFTGKATITGQFQRPPPSRLTGALGRSEPAAGIAWHRHPLGQTLIVTEGVGWTQIDGGPKLEFRVGDILWCPPGHKHWHGATPHGPMAHIAIQETLDGKNVVWMEKVADEEYLGHGP